MSEKKYGGKCRECQERPYTATAGPYVYLCDSCKEARRKERKAGKRSARTSQAAGSKRDGAGLGRPPGDFDGRLRQLVAAHDEGLTVLLEVDDRSFVLTEVEVQVKE